MKKKVLFLKYFFQVHCIYILFQTIFDHYYHFIIANICINIHFIVFSNPYHFSILLCYKPIRFLDLYFRGKSTTTVISNTNYCNVPTQKQQLKISKKKLCEEINNVVRCKRKNIDIVTQLSFNRKNKEDGRLL